MLLLMALHGGMQQDMLGIGMQAWWLHNMKELLLQLLLEGLMQTQTECSTVLQKGGSTVAAPESSQTSGTHPGETAASRGTSSSVSSSCLRPEACCR